MSVDVIITLANMLSNIQQLPWEYALYIATPEANWLGDTKCMVLDPEETDDPDDDPVAAKANGFKYVLTISEVQDIVENIHAQRKNAEVDMLIKALKYYYDNDAFITLD